MRRNRSPLWIGLVLIPMAYPESRDTSLSGLLQDPSGAPLAGARIILTPEGSPADQRSTFTDASGRFTFAELGAATYEIAAQSPGFVAWRKSGLRIPEGQDLQLPTTVLQISAMGCSAAAAGTPQPCRMRCVLYKVKQFFVGKHPPPMTICY